MKRKRARPRAKPWMGPEDTTPSDRSPSETNGVPVLARGAGGGVGSEYLRGTECPFGGMGVGMVVESVSVPHAPELCTCNGDTGEFMLRLCQDHWKGLDGLSYIQVTRVEAASLWDQETPQG